MWKLPFDWLGIYCFVFFGLFYLLLPFAKSYRSEDFHIITFNWFNGIWVLFYVYICPFLAVKPKDGLGISWSIILPLDASWLAVILILSGDLGSCVSLYRSPKSTILPIAKPASLAATHYLLAATYVARFVRNAFPNKKHFI